MTFERLKARYQNGTKKGPATISLTGRGLPRVNLSLSGPLAKEADLTCGEKVHLSLGAGMDAGKILIERADDGVFTTRVLKGSAVLIDGGFIDAVGTVAQKKRSTTARVISAGVVEIDIPDFNAGDDDDIDEEGDEPDSASSSQPQKSHPSPRTAAPKGAKAETVNGITVDLTLDNESITFAGKALEVTTRQAKFIYLLARPRPAPVAVSFLINALWDGRPPGSATSAVTQMAADLQKALSPIGLNLNLVKGGGYQLKDL